MPGLATGRGAGGNDEEEPPSDEELPNKYFQIQACGPGGIAAADGGFAKRLLDTCKKYAAKKPAGFMYWPRDFAKARWSPGEIATSGGEDYMVPFGEVAAKAKQEEEKKATPAPVQEQPKVVVVTPQPTAASASVNKWIEVKGHDLAGFGDVHN